MKKSVFFLIQRTQKFKNQKCNTHVETGCTSFHCWGKMHFPTWACIIVFCFFMTVISSRFPFPSPFYLYVLSVMFYGALLHKELMYFYILHQCCKIRELSGGAANSDGHQRHSRNHAPPKHCETSSPHRKYGDVSFSEFTGKAKFKNHHEHTCRDENKRD